jgi:hypothetical protein
MGGLALVFFAQSMTCGWMAVQGAALLLHDFAERRARWWRRWARL